MDELREALGTYLRQQSELDMPDLIFEPGFVRCAYLPAPGAPTAILQKKNTPVTASAPVPPRAATPAPAAAFSAARTKRTAPRSDFSLVELDAPAAAPAQPPSAKREELKTLFFSTRDCKNCGLSTGRKNVVFGSGNVDAGLMVIGEAPGADEDEQGNPFVGKAGMLLTDMLAAIHLDRKQDVFITNIVKCRPPENRNPESAEILACRTILQRQIAIIRPRAFLLLGRVAAHTLLDTTESVGRLRTREHVVNGAPAVVTYHPAALLRSPEYKRPAWEDLQKLDKILKAQ